jgi:protein TonB
MRQLNLAVAVCAALLLAQGSLMPAAFAQTDGISSSASPMMEVSALAASKHLVKRERPVYPELAKEAHVQGTVVIQIIIRADGSVTNTKLISAPPMLIQSAMDAVQKWRYAPFLQDGKAVPVRTTVSVNYTLGS